jgi:hypothetical protein
MKSSKMFSLVAMAAISLIALAGAGTASATELYKLTSPNPSDTLGAGTELEMSLASGTSALWKQTFNAEYFGNVETCVSGTTRIKIESAGGGEGVHPTGKFTGFGYGLCARPMAVLKSGQVEIQHIPGTTNGTVISKEAEVTIYSPIFGVSCITKTGTGTKTGTLTGATSSTGFATFDVEASNVPYGICGTIDVTSTFTVTKPAGLVVEGS